MNEIAFELVQPRESDAALVLGWRNDPDSRQASFHREVRAWEAFWPRFLQDCARPELAPLFARSADERVGFLRFDPAAHPDGSPWRRCCELSINFAPGRRGRGLGTTALAGVRSVLRARGWDDVVARVRAENARSRRAFEKAGWDLLGEGQELIDTGERAAVALYAMRLTARFAPLEKPGRVFVIAEAGSNWRQGTPERDRAMGRALIDAAAAAGADAVKFQTYRPETVYVENAGRSEYLAAAGIREDIRRIFADLAMPYEMIPDLAARCRERGVAFMSTPFSHADLAALDPHVAVHKCASYESGHLRLLEAFARTGKPLLLSTGAATEDDVAWAIHAFRAAGGGELCLLQCTARYPAPAESLNLAVIPRLKARFGLPVGLSDHSRDPLVAPLAAVALGARVIEKHFTLHNALPGPDHAFAVTPDELTRMVAAIRALEPAIGQGIKEVLPAEQELRAFARRGIQALRPIKRGEPLQEGDNVEALRPGVQRRGLEPRHLPRLAGRSSARDIPTGDGVQEEDLA